MEQARPSVSSIDCDTPAYALPNEPARRNLGDVDVVDPSERDVREVKRVRAVGGKQLGRIGCRGVCVPEELGQRLGFGAVSEEGERGRRSASTPRQGTRGRGRPGQLATHTTTHQTRSFSCASVNCSLTTSSS